MSCLYLKQHDFCFLHKNRDSLLLRFDCVSSSDLLEHQWEQLKQQLLLSPAVCRESAMFIGELKIVARLLTDVTCVSPSYAFLFPREFPESLASYLAKSLHS